MRYRDRHQERIEEQHPATRATEVRGRSRPPAGSALSVHASSALDVWRLQTPPTSSERMTLADFGPRDCEPSEHLSLTVRCEFVTLSAHPLGGSSAWRTRQSTAYGSGALARRQPAAAALPFARVSELRLPSLARLILAGLDSEWHRVDDLQWADPGTHRADHVLSARPASSSSTRRTGPAPSTSAHMIPPQPPQAPRGVLDPSRRPRRRSAACSSRCRPRRSMRWSASRATPRSAAAYAPFTPASSTANLLSRLSSFLVVLDAIQSCCIADALLQAALARGTVPGCREPARRRSDRRYGADAPKGRPTALDPPPPLGGQCRRRRGPPTASVGKLLAASQMAIRRSMRRCCASAMWSTLAKIRPYAISSPSSYSTIATVGDLLHVDVLPHQGHPALGDLVGGHRSTRCRAPPCRPPSRLLVTAAVDVAGTTVEAVTHVVAVVDLGSCGPVSLTDRRPSRGEKHEVGRLRAVDELTGLQLRSGREAVARRALVDRAIAKSLVRVPGDPLAAGLGREHRCSNENVEGEVQRPRHLLLCRRRRRIG